MDVKRTPTPRPACLAMAGLTVLALAPLAPAAPVIIDDFEGNEGHFASGPGTSGSNRNIGRTTTADQTNAAAHTGTGSEQVNVVVLQPGETQENGVGFNPNEGWRLRFLSGGGNPANNVNIGPDGYVGYFIRTTTPGLQASIILDDLPGPVGTPGDHEIANYQDIIADGQFHLYQFNIDDPNGYTRFAGSNTATGGIDGPTVTIDAIVLRYPLLENRPDATVYIDTVAYNPDGDLSSLIPEPASAGLLAAAAAGLLAPRPRRRR